MATQTYQETHLNLERLVGGAPYGVIMQNGKIMWPPERTVLTVYAASSVLEPESVYPIGVYRIAQHKGSLFSFSVDIGNLRGYIVRRSNAMSERCEADDWKTQMKLNSKLLSVNGFFGTPSSQNISGVMISMHESTPDFFKEELDVILSPGAGDIVKFEKFIYKCDMTDFGRDTLNRAIIFPCWWTAPRSHCTRSALNTGWRTMRSSVISAYVISASKRVSIQGLSTFLIGLAKGAGA
jgi:hypothetical protein